MICASARSAIRVTAARSGVCTVMRAAAGRADRRAGRDVAIATADDAMMTDPQDRKGHYLISPVPVPVPPLFPPITHSGTPGR